MKIFDVFILSDLDFSDSYNFSTGLFLNFVLPRNQGKWSINNELHFASYNLEQSYTDFKNEDYYTVCNITMKYPYLKLNNMVRMRFSAGNSVVYFNIGITNVVADNRTETVKITGYKIDLEKVRETVNGLGYKYVV